MKIYLSPQVSEDNEYIKYSFEGEKITATYKGITDVFDFTGMPNGIASAITTTLAINPIISAKRIDNVLSVEVINTISGNASHDERFPEWIDSKDIPPVAEKEGDKIG